MDFKKGLFFTALAAIMIGMSSPGEAAFTVYTKDIQFVAPDDGLLESVTIQNQYVNVIYRNGEYAGCEWYPVSSPKAVLERWYYPYKTSPDAPDFIEKWMNNAKKTGNIVEALPQQKGILLIYRIEENQRTIAQALYVKYGILYSVHYYSSRRPEEEVRQTLYAMADTMLQQNQSPRPETFVISDADRSKLGGQKDAATSAQTK